MARGLNYTKIQRAYFREWVKNSETVHQNKWFKLVQNNNFYSIDYHAVQVVVLPVIEENTFYYPKSNDRLSDAPSGNVLPEELKNPRPTKLLHFVNSRRKLA